MSAVDAAGHHHVPAGAGARIVSLVPSITELLFALDLGSQVAGRTSFCVHPRSAVQRIPRVGGTKTPRLDRIRELAATHVIVNVDENRREDAERLTGMGLQVVTTHPLAPHDNPTLYHLLGDIFERRERAEALTRAFTDAHDALRDATTRRRRRNVLYLIWREPWMTVSRDTYIAHALADAGLDTIGHDPGRRYPEVPMTPELLAGVDSVLLPSEPFPFKTRHRDEVRQLAGNPDLDVRLIDGEMTSWYGNRAIEACAYLDDFANALGDH